MNGILQEDDLSKDGLSNNTTIDGISFIANNNTSANIFVDDLSITATVPSTITSGLSDPAIFDLGGGNYSLTSFASTTTPATYPANMILHYGKVNVVDPALTDIVATQDYTTNYNLSAQSRITGQGTGGTSFLNTSPGHSSATSGNIGEAVLGLKTTGRTSIQVTWKAGTQTNNGNRYKLRAQYRVGNSGSYTDLPGATTAIEYTSPNASATFGPITLPAACENVALVQVRWAFYWSGSGSGLRDEIFLDDISVSSTASGTAPTVTTGTTGTITYQDAVLNGNVTAVGSPTGSSNEKGFVYAATATNASPTIGGTGCTKVVCATATLTTGAYSCSTPSTLSASTGYSWVAYATNGFSTSYGSVSTFSTSAAPTANYSITDEPSGGPTLSHGTSCVGTAAASKTYRITNTGGAAGTPASVTSSSGQFVVSGFTSSSLAASGGNTTFVVTFTPSSGGAQSATITVNGANSPTLALTGNGTALAVPPAPTANTKTAGSYTSATLAGTTTAATCPSALTEQGIVYSSSVSTPTLADSKQVFADNTPGTKTVSVTGLTAGTRYYFRTYATNSQGTTYNATVDQFNTRKPEPTNFSSAITNSATGTTSLSFQFTNNDGVAKADSFLVLLSAGSTPADPIDGVVPAAAASSVVWIANAAGTLTASFTGLSANTSYTVKVAPMVNTGTPTAKDYKVGAGIQTLTVSTAAAPYEDFETGTKTGYAIASVTLTSGSWTLDNVLLGNTAGSDRFNGTKSARMNSGTMYMNFDLATGAGNVTVNAARYGTDGVGGYQLNVSTDGGVTWTAYQSAVTAVNTTSLVATVFIVNLTGNVRLQIVQTSGNRINIDDIYITAPAAGPRVAITGQANNSTYAYGSKEVNTNTDQTFTFTNTGSATLNISSITAGGAPFSILSTSPAGLAAGGTLAAAASATVTVRFTPTGFSAATGTLVINSDALNAAAYTVNITGTGIPSANSDVIANAAYVYNNTIDYTAYQAATITSTANSIDVFKFDVRDGGGAADNDALPTILNSITFSSVVGIAGIRQAALFNGNTFIAQASSINAGAGTIAFTGLSGANVTAADGGTASLTLRVTFLTSGITDNQAIQVSIASADLTAPGGNTSSSFKTFTTVTSSAAKNKTVVTATQIGFVTQPSGSVNVSTNFTISVQAQDANGNRDVDATGSITLVKLTGSGTLTGTLTPSYSSGLASAANLQLDQITTGVTIQATASNGAYSPSVITTASFDVSSYITGAYRTKATGTTSYSTVSNWEVWNGSAFVASTDYPDNSAAVIYIERNMSTGTYPGANLRYRANKVYVRNNATFTISTDGGKGLAMVGNDAEFNVASGSTAQVNEYIDFNNTPATSSAGSIDPTTGKLTVESGGTLVINFNAYNRALFWNGVENFKPGSTVEIQNWLAQSAVPGATTGNEFYLVDPIVQASKPRNVSLNADGYYFGNLKITSTTLAEDFYLYNTAGTANLVENDLTVSTGDFTNFVILNDNKAQLTLGGNLTVSSCAFAFYTATVTGTPQTTINGNLVLTGNGSIDLNATVSGTTTVSVLVKGDYTSSGTADISSTHSGSAITFSGTAATHNVTQTSTYNPANLNLTWNIPTGNTVYIKSSNWQMSSNSGIIVASGGVLNLSDGLSTPYAISENNSSNNTFFTVQAGGTLYVTDPDGITTAASGNLGSIRTDIRTFDAAGNYYYKGYSGTTPATGNALPATLTGTITYEPFNVAHQWILSNAAGYTINTPGGLVIKNGVVVENATTGPTISGNGTLAMTGGEYRFQRANVALVPRLSGNYTLTGGQVSLNAGLSTGQTQTLRGGAAYPYWNVALTGSTAGTAYKTVSSATTINNNLSLIAGEVLDISNAVSGPGGLTMTGGLFRTSKITGTQPELLATATGASYNLTGGTVEFYGTTAAQSQTIRGTDGNGNNISYYNVTINAGAANTTSGNVDPQASLGIKGTFTVNSPAVLNLDATDAISGVGLFNLLSGGGLRYANQYGITQFATGGTGTTAGNVRTSTRTFSSTATYILAGAQASAVTGDALPATVDYLTNQRTVATTISAPVTVSQALTFAGTATGNLVTGSNPITLAPTASIVGESSSAFVLGTLNAAARNVAQNVTESFGGMGIDVLATGAAPGNTTVTRKTGPGAIQTGYMGNQSTVRYYDISAVNNTGLAATLTFYYFDSELNSIPEGLLNAYRSTDAGATWSEYGAVARNPSSNIIKVQGVPGFSRWALASYNAPLPITWEDFSGKVEDDGAALSWSTASEAGNAGFTVERSADGRSFKAIGTVAPAPDARQGAGYAYLDKAFPGSAYYHIRQQDRDGATSTSQTIYLSRTKTLTALSLYPNPAAKAPTLRIDGYTGQATLTFITAEGKLALKATGTVDEINAALANGFTALPNALYATLIQTDSEVVRMAFVKQ